MYYLEHSEGEYKRMRNAVLAAMALHLLLVFAVSFSSQSTPRSNPQIEVTLATRPSQTAPEEARHIAQQNQQGAGDEAQVEAVSSRNNQFPQQAELPQQSAPRQIDTESSASGDLLSTAAAAPRSSPQRVPTTRHREGAASRSASTRASTPITSAAPGWSKASGTGWRICWPGASPAAR